jgi:hypothetical protein
VSRAKSGPGQASTHGSQQSAWRNNANWPSYPSVARKKAETRSVPLWITIDDLPGSDQLLDLAGIDGDWTEGAAPPPGWDATGLLLEFRLTLVQERYLKFMAGRGRALEVYGENLEARCIAAFATLFSWMNLLNV